MVAEIFLLNKGLRLYSFCWYEATDFDYKYNIIVQTDVALVGCVHFAQWVSFFEANI